MTATHFSGPLQVGPKIAGDTPGANQGFAVVQQAVAITQAGVGTVSATFYVPAGSRILGFNVDVLTAFDSVTTATLSIGTAAAGTQYASGVNAKTAGRTIPTYTAAQLAKMNGVSIVGVADAVAETVVVSVITVGATAAGYLVVTCQYAQLV